MSISPVMWALLFINKGAVAVNLGGVFDGGNTTTVGGSEARHFVTSGSTSGIEDP